MYYISKCKYADRHTRLELEVPVCQTINCELEKQCLFFVSKVISPFESCFESELVVAGYYYYKTHTSTWQKIWMYLTGKCINIRPLHVSSNLSGFAHVSILETLTILTYRLLKALFVQLLITSSDFQ